MAFTKLQMQQMFDKVVTGLRAQGKRSIKPRTGGADICLYRSNDGCRCAIGMLIDDEAYTPDLENSFANQVNVLHALERSGIVGDWITVGLPSSDRLWDNADAAFLRALQERLHDHIDQDDRDHIDQDDRFLDKLKTAVSVFASDYQLTIPEEAT